VPRRELTSFLPLDAQSELVEIPRVVTHLAELEFLDPVQTGFNGSSSMNWTSGIDVVLSHTIWQLTTG
jgi:hypothetical protein